MTKTKNMKALRNNISTRKEEEFKLKDKDERP